MRHPCLWLLNFFWILIEAQPVLPLRYDFQTLTKKSASYRGRSLLEVEQIRANQIQKQKTTLEYLQKRSFQAQKDFGVVSIQFQELRFFYDYERLTPENTLLPQSLSWNSAHPEWIITSEWGTKSLQDLPKPFQKQIEPLPELVRQTMTLHSSPTGELLKLEWPHVPETYRNNIKNAWILLPPEPISLGGSWTQSLQERLGELGTLEITIQYLLKEWDEKTQIARVEGYFTFRLDDTIGRTRHEAQTALSDESGKIVFDFDCVQGLIRQISRVYQFTLTLTIPTEKEQNMTFKTKIYQQSQETLK